jgi:MFS family permease
MKLSLRYLLISNYINLFGFALFSPLYALFAFRIGAGAFETGIAWALYTGIAGITIIIFGLFEDHLKQKRKLVMFAYFWLSVGALSFLLVKSTTSLYVVQAFNAIGSGMLSPAWKATFSHYQDKGKEASEWSLFDGGNMLCTAAAALLGGYLVKLYGFHIIFILMFAIQFVAALVSIKLLTAVKRKNSY